MKRILLLIMLCSFCNIILAQIKINSEPSGAKVYQEGKYIGTTPCNASTNMKDKQLVYDIDADRVRDPSKPPYSIEFTITMDGYEPANVYFEGTYEYHQSGWVGGGQKYYIVKPKSFNLFTVLKRDNSKPIVQTNTEQNGNIDVKPEIRWHFDSEPDGAKIFWKVKSSIPNTVSSTEFLYLGKTPFKETRPLNINGLTKDNASMVEIEVEIVKKGYTKQVKSFSAKSLLEQQEISWSFDLDEE